jgi:chromosomal replication initiation ATPase DnaA
LLFDTIYTMKDTPTKYHPKYIIAATAREFGINERAITSAPTTNRWQDYSPRMTAMALSVELSGLKLRELSPKFGGCALSGFSRARTKVSDQVRVDRGFAEAVARVVRTLKK